MNGKFLSLWAALFTMLFCSTSAALAQDINNLDAVVVTASKHEETKREVTSNITVLDEKVLKNSTATNLSELMSQQGFQVYSPGGGSTKILYMRGMGGSSMAYSEMNAYTLVLLNGHRRGNGNLGTTSLENIERIEIIRGPTAVQYGASAMGGVVNIITKRGTEDFTARAEVGIGSDGRFDEKLAFSGATQGFDFAVALANTGNDDYRTGNGNIWRRTKVDSQFNLDADVGFTFLEQHRIGGHFNYSKMNDGQLPNSGWSTTKDYPYSFANNDSYSYNSTFDYTGATEDERLKWLASYTFGQTSAKSLSYDDPNDPNAWGPNFYPIPGYTSDNLTKLQQGQLQGTFDQGLFALTAGFDYIKYETSQKTSRTNGSVIGSSKNYAGYLLGKLRLADEKLILSAGGRYDSYTISGYGSSNDETKFTPSVGAAFSPYDFLKLRANYSEGFSVPTPLQWLGDGTNYIANPGLKPQKSQTFEIGADISWEYIDSSITYFTTDFKEAFASVATNIPKPSGWGMMTQYTNLDGSTVSGLEFSLKADLGRAFEQDFELSPYLTMTWLTERKNKDKKNFVTIDPDVLPYTPEFMAAYGLTFDYPAIGLAANINASYFGTRYVQDWSKMDPWTYVAPWVEYGSFTVVDLSITKQICDFGDKGNMDLKGQIGNLLDKDYGYVMNYPMQGRNFYLGLVYNY